jgi:hypothetical protein
MRADREQGRLRFFAVWTARTGYALDVYPDEIDRYRRDIIRRRERFAGPFDTAEEAMAVVCKALEPRRPDAGTEEEASLGQQAKRSQAGVHCQA